VAVWWPLGWVQSQTFFKTIQVAAVDGDGGAGNNTRQFVQSSLVGHKMWRSLSFWEQAFYRSVREAVHKAYGRQLAASDDASIAAGNVPVALRPDSTEWLYMYQQIVFGQLGSYAMNMRAFGVPADQVNRVVRRLGQGNGLSSQLMEVCGCSASLLACVLAHVRPYTWVTQVLFSNAAASEGGDSA